MKPCGNQKIVILSLTLTFSVEGSRRRAPPRQNFQAVWERVCQIIGWYPPPGLVHLLLETLDPPLTLVPLAKEQLFDYYQCILQ